MGQAGHKCNSWKLVRQVTSVAAGDGSGWSQVPVQQLEMGQAGHKFQV